MRKIIGLFFAALFSTGCAGMNEMAGDNNIDLNAYAGSYEVAPGIDLELSVVDGTLYLQAPGQQKVPLQADSENTFSIPAAGAKVVFTKNNEGIVTELALDQGGSRTIGKRKNVDKKDGTILKKSGRIRIDLEAESLSLKQAYLKAPRDDEKRRAYAKNQYELGNIWQAKDIIEPLAKEDSSNLNDLKIGADVALFTQDFDRSEKLFKRLLELSEKDTENYIEAVEGLSLIYYQSNQYYKIKNLPIIENNKNKYNNDFVKYLCTFEGIPYQIEWTSADKTGHLPFTNDFFNPQELPHIDITINGYTFDFILDTGGDRIYIDKTVYKKIGVKPIQNTRNKYAYTDGEYVDEIFGVLEIIELEGVTVRNIPVHVGDLRSRGTNFDGVITTQFLKQFLSTVDYENKEITLRERSKSGKSQFLRSMAKRKIVSIPFFMSETHFMFAKGNFNGHKGMNMFIDSGLASNQEAVILNETADLLGLEKEEVAGTRFYISNINSVGLDGLGNTAGQVLGNVFVEEDNYRCMGFFWDGLISHKYLWTKGSWTIDFDTMTYYFPEKANEFITSKIKKPVEKRVQKIKLDNPEPYIGTYEVAPGTDLRITAKKGTLMLQPPGQDPIGIDAYSDGTFGIPLADVIIEFERDEAGGITGLIMTQGGNVTHASKK